jgi:hypothetical protein
MENQKKLIFNFVLNLAQTRKTCSDVVVSPLGPRACKERLELLSYSLDTSAADEM